MTGEKWRAGCAHGCDWLGPVRDDQDDAYRDGAEHLRTVRMHEWTEGDR